MAAQPRPEQINDENVSRLTDIYAASVVLWETLTGRRLFVANDERGILGRVLSSPVPAPRYGHTPRIECAKPTPSGAGHSAKLHSACL